MKIGNLVQLAIICIGIPLGMYLSNRSNVLHLSLQHPIITKHTNMNHGLMDVSLDDIIPTITKLEVQKDEMSGWNIFVKTENFIFSPHNVNKPNVPGRGHAHIYINGQKHARMYSPHMHVPELASSLNEIKVTLNSNNHQTLAIGDQPIQEIWKKNKNE